MKRKERIAVTLLLEPASGSPGNSDLQGVMPEGIVSRKPPRRTILVMHYQAHQLGDIRYQAPNPPPLSWTLFPLVQDDHPAHDEHAARGLMTELERATLVEGDASAQASTIRQRNANAWLDFARRAQRCKVARS